jgi:hypothetical protein
VSNQYRLSRDNFFLLRHAGYSETQIEQRFAEFKPIPELEDMLEGLMVEKLMTEAKNGQKQNEDIAGWKISAKCLNKLTDSGYAKQDVTRIAWEWKTEILLNPSVTIVDIDAAFLGYFKRLKLSW